MERQDSGGVIEYPARRVLPSSRDYAELNALQMRICLAQNPACVFTGEACLIDLDALDLILILDSLSTAMGKAMQEQEKWCEFLEIARAA